MSSLASLTVDDLQKDDLLMFAILLYVEYYGAHKALLLGQVWPQWILVVDALFTPGRILEDYSRPTSIYDFICKVLKGMIYRYDKLMSAPSLSSNANDHQNISLADKLVLKLYMEQKLFYDSVEAFRRSLNELIQRRAIGLQDEAAKVIRSSAPHLVQETNEFSPKLTKRQRLSSKEEAHDEIKTKDS